MAIQQFATEAARIGKVKGITMTHAIPKEAICRVGRQIPFPEKMGDTYVARRWLPYGGTAGTTTTRANTQNRFFADATGDRAQAMVTTNTLTEGTTPGVESISKYDIEVTIAQYGCLYAYTDKTAYFYEDDIPMEMLRQIGERMTLVNEMICFAKLKGGTNQFYAGTGTSLATVNGGISLEMLRKISRNIQANHGEEVTSVLRPSTKFNTDSAEPGYFVYIHSDLRSDIRDMPHFVSSDKYASGKPMAMEVGKVEEFRFISSPDLISHQDAGANIGSLGLVSTTGTRIDVYRFIVVAKECFSQLAVRGGRSMDVAIHPPNKKDKSDPLGQRGFTGCSWWKATFIENDGWMAVGNVGAKTL